MNREKEFWDKVNELIGGAHVYVRVLGEDRDRFAILLELNHQDYIARVQLLGDGEVIYTDINNLKNILWYSDQRSMNC